MRAARTWWMIPLIWATCSAFAIPVAGDSRQRQTVSENRAVNFLKEALRKGDFTMSCDSVGECMACPLGKGANTLVLAMLLDVLYWDPDTDLSMVEEELGEIALGRLFRYAKMAPVDSDSSAYALLALDKAGHAVDYTSLLDMYEPLAEGFVTFREGVADPRSYHLVRSRGLCPKENSMIHPEVNLNVYRAMLAGGMEDMVNYDLISRSMGLDGSVTSMYYPSDYYGPWLATEVLSRIEDPDGLEERVVEFILSSQNSDGSWGAEGDGWDTALALNALAASGVSGEAVARGLGFLRSIQNEDGGWRSDSVIWSYELEYAGCREEWGARDHNGIIVTALALQAIQSLGGNR